MKIFNDNWVTTVFQILTAVLVVCFVVFVILIFSKATPDQGAAVVIREYVEIIDDPNKDLIFTIEDPYLADNIITIDTDPPTTIVIQGKPRMMTPEAIIDFSGDKVTYSGDLPVDEAAKVFFEAVMGFVKEAKECKCK